MKKSRYILGLIIIGLCWKVSSQPVECYAPLQMLKNEGDIGTLNIGNSIINNYYSPSEELNIKMDELLSILANTDFTALIDMVELDKMRREGAERVKAIKNIESNLLSQIMYIEKIYVELSKNISLIDSTRYNNEYSKAKEIARDIKMRIESSKCLIDDYGEVITEITDATGKSLFVFPLDVLKENPYYLLVDDYQNGLARVRKFNKFGFFDISGNIAIPFKYDFAFPFMHEKTFVKNGKEWYGIMKNGKETNRLVDKSGDPIDDMKMLSSGNFITSNSKGRICLVDVNLNALTSDCYVSIDFISEEHEIILFDNHTMVDFRGNIIAKVDEKNNFKIKILNNYRFNTFVISQHNRVVAVVSNGSDTLFSAAKYFNNYRAYKEEKTYLRIEELVDDEIITGSEIICYDNSYAKPYIRSYYILTPCADFFQTNSSTIRYNLFTGNKIIAIGKYPVEVIYNRITCESVRVSNDIMDIVSDVDENGNILYRNSSNSSDYYGMIDTTGRTLLPGFSYIKNLGNARYVVCSPYYSLEKTASDILDYDSSKEENYYLRVSKCAVVDEKGRFLTEQKYNFIKPYTKGYALVSILNVELIRSTGKVFKKSWTAGKNEKHLEQEYLLYGVIDINGVEVAPVIFNKIEIEKEKMFLYLGKQVFELTRDGKCVGSNCENYNKMLLKYFKQ